NLTGTTTQTVIPADAFTLSATHPQTGLKVSVTGAFAAGQTTTTQNVIFANSVTVTGTVINGTGAPMTGLSVRLRATTSALDVTTTTDGSGRFAFSGLAAGSYQLSASDPATHVAALVTISANTGQTIDVPVAIDSTAPQVTITNPAGGTTIDPRSALPVTVNA